MESLYPLFRTIHVLSGSLWIGEVLVINVVLIPVLARYSQPVKKAFITSVFPRIFNLASILSLTSVVTGLFLIHVHVGDDISKLFSGRWGISILIGGGLGILLTLFHFFMENRLAKKIGLGKKGDQDQLEDVHLKLKLVPRLGLVVILSIFLLMVNAVRGIF